MKVVYLAAGAAGMYCGSCLRDNRLAATLIDQGRDITLVPLYTPIRTDERDVSERRIYYGGINVFLQQSASVFRHTPRWLDRILDARSLLSVAARWAGSTRAEDLGALTASVLRGEHGPQRKELDKLIDGLAPLKPDVVNLANLMFVGLARRLKESLGAAVVCTLGGEDVFLDRLAEPHRTEVFDLIQERGRDIDAFIAMTGYYADHAAGHFKLPRDRVHVVPMGIRAEEFRPADPPDEPFTIGYLARICPQKGLAELCRAFALLRATGRDCRLLVGGYLGPGDRAYFRGVESYLREQGLAGVFEFAGELSRDEKIRFLGRCHVLSVPSVYHEAKGFYILEALAAGVPVVQPAVGSFPELIEATGGGVLCEPDDTQSLADAIAGLMDDSERRRALGEAGRAAVRASFTAERMAEANWGVYEKLVATGR